jgi:hypothetical protein
MHETIAVILVAVLIFVTAMVLGAGVEQASAYAFVMAVLMGLGLTWPERRRYERETREV